MTPPLLWLLRGFLVFCGIDKGEQLSKPGFYYHLSELKNADIIEVAEYIEEGGGAPEKIWRLKTKKIIIDLLKTKEEVT